ncbi:MAG: hypothetical protein ONB48_14395 [candidate division KSB1 bacterium]|nr:hypothetical protein [candidate division KSB1 bacterium]MDZ7273573.1 hypothetical protein [candidate division KSB1 bacterium]MDZ7286836.1 hypothetical protein [candidate division KSB1 bacterium]MDZ7299807.1 hypothetical protein [candidate division KSB1 bacterium]MDZ7309434.1 hypothetical protein [candidate division KSB1 bacterium]
MKRLLLLAAALLSPLAAPAQYWNDYLLEKGFDERGYFLRPHRLLSLNLKNLDSGLLGVLPDYLGEISFQPARLSSRKGSQLYLDLKGSAEKPKAPKDHIYPLYNHVNSYFLPPFYARPAQRQLEPLLSAIYLGKVAAKYLPELKYALSYELIHHSGTFYEYVPYWYSGAYDAFGMRTEESSRFPEIEPNLKQDGLDEKTETAHMMTVHLSVKPAEFFSAGAKLSRTVMDITGDYVRFNDYSQNFTHAYQARYRNEKNAGAALRQNEVSAGMLFTLPGARQIGFFGGGVTGHHNQTGGDRDSSFYSYGAETDPEYFSRSYYSHRSNSRWRHAGTTHFAGVHGEWPLPNHIVFRFRLEYHEADLDLANSGAMRDTSYHRYRYYPGNVLYESIYNSKFTDDRLGTGTETRRRKSSSAGLVIPMYKNSEATVAVHFEQDDSRTLMYEDAQVYRASRQLVPAPWSPAQTTIGIEDKTLHLDKHGTTTRVTLPVAMTFGLGSRWSLHLAAIKQYLRVAVDEVVDIWYRTDSLIVIGPEDDTRQNSPERGDRYRAVPVRRSETSLHFRAGVSFQPAGPVRIDVGLGASPADLETWQFAVLFNL